MHDLCAAERSELVLRAPTPLAWVTAVEADLPAFLKDHAACERKAAAAATSLIAHYPDVPWLVRPMVALAREELQHFAEVHALLVARGITPGPDEKDPYVRALMGPKHPPGREGLLYRLLLAGVIEARGAERFGLLATGLEDAALRDFYTRLRRSERGHATQFLKLAQGAFPANEVSERLEQLCIREAEVMAAQALRARLH